MKTLGTIAVALFVPGGLVIVAIAWLRRRWLARAARTIAAQIASPVVRFGPIPESERASLRATAERRRAAAADKRREAARIEAGLPVDERLRLLRGGGRS